MSQRYKGGVISATPPTTSTSSASGVWTEQQFMQGVASGSWPALAGAPTIGTATAGALSASVTFTAPTYTGSGITGYTVTSSPGGITGTGASSPVTVSGLTAGTPYTFTVTATTAAGQGPASAASNSVTPTAPNYIEDVYSTYLYTGNGSTQTITNGIDLSTYGGLVWYKARSNLQNNWLIDSSRGTGNALSTNTTNAQTSGFPGSFNTDGFSAAVNSSPFTYASWTFRKQAKFFDVVTYTGNGSARTIAHNLGSVPACMIIKDCTNAGSAWAVYHTSLGNTQYLQLQSTGAAATSSGYWNNTTPTSTEFTVGTNGNVNQSGATYVAYLFASNAGGFGLTGTDNVISCGSYVGTSANFVDVNLGYEPQWFMVKKADATGPWYIIDNMRDMSYSGTSNLQANASNAEQATVPQVIPSATGISLGYSGGGSGYNVNGTTYIYIAIRRGPMKIPTTGTTVFSPVAYTGTGTSTAVTTPGFPPDVLLQARRSAPDWPMSNRLAGVGQNLAPCYTSAENTPSPAYVDSYNMTGATIGTGGNAVNGSGLTYIQYYFQRAPSFFDEVCYTGTGTSTTDTIRVNHNLGVKPELLITKSRSAGSTNWGVYAPDILPKVTGNYTFLKLNLTDAIANSYYFDVTSTYVDYIRTGTSTNSMNDAGTTYVSYLFATCAGVSKVGSYTGTGALQTINCGFAAGARFVLIKRTDSTGDWYTYDSARGISSSSDPYLLLNSTAAEVTGTNYVDTTSVGFQVTAAAPAGLNASGGTYIFLAIA